MLCKDAYIWRKEVYLNCFQFVRGVLDELYSQICSTYGNEADQIVKKAIVDLSEKYGKLESKNDINYRDPVTRFAYIYSYTTAHADIVYQLIQGSTPLRSIFQSPIAYVSCIGGGPGSDLLGILKFITLISPPMQKLKCFVCDKEQAWRNSFSDIDDKLSLSVLTSTIFWELDVTEPTSISNSSKAFHSELFTMIYFVSELYYYREDARDFFEAMIDQAKPGALFLFVDNNAEIFYGWMDEMATSNGLSVVERKEDYRFVLGWDEQAHELATYTDKFNRHPKIQTYIAYRIYAKA